MRTANGCRPTAEAPTEIAYAARFTERFGEKAKRLYGGTIPPHGADKRILLLKQPIGSP